MGFLVTLNAAQITERIQNLLVYTYCNESITLNI